MTKSQLMKKAWQFAKGMMTEKQESFIASLIARGKYVENNTVLQAFQISSLRSRITKQQASDLISELLNA